MEFSTCSGTDQSDLVNLICRLPPESRLRAPNCASIIWSPFFLHDDGAGEVTHVCVPLARVVPWLFHSILLLTSLLHKAAAQKTASLAKPGCSQYCGNVVIPFPFGIRENCHLNKWFEIKCEAERPSLASVGLDVLQITLATYEEKPGIIRVQSPIIYLNCSGVGSTNASVSLEGSPFVFSQTKNRFSAVGCNTRALLIDGYWVRVGLRRRYADSAFCPSYLGI